jgi:hypothetical protein
VRDEETIEDLMRRRTGLQAGQQMMQGLLVIGFAFVLAAILWYLELRFSLAPLAVGIAGVGLFLRGFTWWATV